VQSNLSRDAYLAVAEIAKEQNISSSATFADRLTAWEAADAGQRSIEHLTNVLRGCSRNEAELMLKQFRDSSRGGQLAWQRELLDSYSEENAAKLIEKFHERQTWQTHAAHFVAQCCVPSADANLTSDPRAKYVPRQIACDVERRLRAANQQCDAPCNFPCEKRCTREVRSALPGKCKEAASRYSPPDDSAAPYVFPGSSLHEELARLVEAGADADGIAANGDAKPLPSSRQVGFSKGL